MSTLHVVDGWMGQLAHLADLASGARTWSVCVLAIAVAGGLRWTEHLGDAAFEGIVQAALVAIAGRAAVVHAWKGRPPASSVVPRPAVDERPTNPR